MRRNRSSLLVASLLLVVWSCSINVSSVFAAGDLIIDADFPGGNIILERIEGDTVFLRPDQRDSSTWWFYWNFRVRDAAGRAVKFQFLDRNPIGTRGPAISTDGGHTWSWLIPGTTQESSFTYTFKSQDREVRFCFSIPYLESNLRQFMQKHANNPHLAAHELCRSRAGRSVERLHAGKITGNPRHRVLLTARHHACESIASYSLEGLLETALSDTAVGRWFCDNVEILAIPFVDTDGVEAGDQGKNRKPHDHNRDYAGDSIYPSVRTLRRFIPEWSGGKLKVILDLHCPYISGEHNEAIYLVGSSDPVIWTQQKEFAAILESAREGPLPYFAQSSLPFGTSWNVAGNYGKHKSCSRWGSQQSLVSLSSTIEIPYANVGAAVVTAENARAFGRDLALTLRRYLESLESEHN